MKDINEAPCLVETARGVSVLYKNRHLFSRFDPQKAFTSVLHTTSILDESLIVCISPVLEFPVTAIIKKLKDDSIKNCFALAVEHDTMLYDFFHSQIGESLQSENFASICIENETDISLLLEGMPNSSRMQGKELPNISGFKRVIVFEASSEVNLHRDFYSSVVHYTQNSISQFWKNRMTLVKLGKLFSKNTLVNVRNLSHSITAVKQCIVKPILVVGAGTSLDDTISFIKKHNNYFYVLSIAAAVQSLSSQGIKIDAIVSLEGQFATDKAFIGLENKDVLFFADIASRPSVFKLFTNVSLFLSEYTKSALLERIKKLFPSMLVLPPLGSVGLTAVELALFLRNSVDTPVFFTGLDFAFPVGKTHAKESPHVRESLNNSNKLLPVGNVAMSFRHGTFEVKNSSKNLVSDSGLKVYTDLFNERYKNVENLFNLSEYGMVNNSFYCNEQKAERILSKYSVNWQYENAFENIDNSKVVEQFYQCEKEKLEEIKNMLTGKVVLNEKKLLELLEECSYLYMHFPDAHKGTNLRQDFLNRVRGEVDVFLKQLLIVL